MTRLKVKRSKHIRELHNQAWVVAWDCIKLSRAYKLLQGSKKYQKRDHVDFFLKITIQEDIFNIQLRYNKSIIIVIFLIRAKVSS